MRSVILPAPSARWPSKAAQRRRSTDARSPPTSRLAEFHGVPVPYLAKHLQAMSRAGILDAYETFGHAAETRALKVIIDA